VKIAQYRSVKHDYITIGESREFYENKDDFIRMTEYVEVDFVERPREEIVNIEIQALKDLKKEIHAAAQARVMEIDRKISDLLAITQED